MPFFNRASSSANVPWGWDGNSMSRQGDPPFAQLALIHQSEINKLNDYYTYKSMQTTSEKTDLATLSRLKGHAIAPPVRKTITPDPSIQGAMNPYVGQSWPTMRHDFGVNMVTADGMMPQFKINFEHAKANIFADLDPLLPIFQRLGQNIDMFQDALLDMKEVEDQILDPVRNPHPKDKWGRKIKYDYWGAKLVLRNETRYAFQYHFNQMADEAGAYLHMRFEKASYWANDRSGFDQCLVFTFPESNEERDIWRHVFWDEDYPETGFPVRTEYSREITRIEETRGTNGRNIDDLNTAMGNAQI